MIVRHFRHASVTDPDGKVLGPVPGSITGRGEREGSNTATDGLTEYGADASFGPPMLDALTPNVPFKRLGTPEDFAALAVHIIEIERLRDVTSRARECTLELGLIDG